MVLFIAFNSKNGRRRRPKRNKIPTSKSLLLATKELVLKRMEKELPQQLNSKALSGLLKKLKVKGASFPVNFDYEHTGIRITAIYKAKTGKFLQIVSSEKLRKSA
ncbi:MAG: hypothetical protein NTY48_05460 [Candidatus Diapherotrites archaeon]|nr:hypothetical protein [Candidatus Diapherotrites archaeon]